MKSKIMVEFDLDKNEPYLQCRIEGDNEDGGALADKFLKNFVERANWAGGLTIEYFGSGNSLPQIRIGVRPTIKVDSPQSENIGNSLPAS